MQSLFKSGLKTPTHMKLSLMCALLQILAEECIFAHRVRDCYSRTANAALFKVQLKSTKDCCKKRNVEMKSPAETVSRDNPSQVPRMSAPEGELWNGERSSLCTGSAGTDIGSASEAWGKDICWERKDQLYFTSLCSHQRCALKTALQSRN